MVSVKYGKVTNKEFLGFEYSANPKILDYTPRSSFIWWVCFYEPLGSLINDRLYDTIYEIYLCVFSGGRKILVTGSGFEQVQKATMVVLPSGDENDGKSSNVKVIRSQ